MGESMKALLCFCLFFCLSLQASEKEAVIGTNKISYLISGKGTNAFVFVHGWGGTKELWTSQIKALEGDYRILALDLPGHGKSSKPAKGYTMKHFSDAIHGC